MSSFPSPAIQQRILANVDKIYASDGHWLYGVSNQWMTNFKHQFKNESDVSQTSIENSCLPLTVDAKIENNDFISEKWWKIFVSWYGVERNTAIIRHPTSSAYLSIMDGNVQHTVLSHKEKDFLTISVCLLADYEDETLHKSIMLYGWDTFDFVEYQIRRLFKISPKCKSRLWINIQENGCDTIFDNLGELSGPVITKVSHHLPWMSKLLCARSQSTSPTEKNTSDPFSLFEHNVKVIVSLEKFAVDLTTNKNNAQGWIQHAIDLEGECDSIVTLATINDRWDELFTNYLDEFTKEVGDIAADKRGVLMDAAKEIVSEKVVQTEKLKAKMDEKMRWLDEREKRLNEREAAAISIEEDYKLKLVKYKEGLDSFMKEKNRLEAEWRNVWEQNRIKDSQMTLNIGGIRFTTSLTTLTNVQDSYFVHLFCGTHIPKPCEDGSYFFDRDGTHFRYILNYLRNGPNTITSIPNDETILHELLGEAKYYRLSELETLIQEKIDTPKVEMVGDMEYVSYPSCSSLSSK